MRTVSGSLRCHASQRPSSGCHTRLTLGLLLTGTERGPRLVHAAQQLGGARQARRDDSDVEHGTMVT